MGVLRGFPKKGNCVDCELSIIRDTPSRKLCHDCAIKRKKIYGGYIPINSRHLSKCICVLCKREFRSRRNSKSYCSWECKKKMRKIEIMKKHIQKYEDKIMVLLDA